MSVDEIAGRRQFEATVTFFWKDREGHSRSITESAGHIGCGYSRARSAAIARGYPGHKGGRWNWFIDDSHVFLCKLFRHSCDCHRH